MRLISKNIILVCILLLFSGCLQQRVIVETGFLTTPFPTRAGDLPSYVTSTPSLIPKLPTIIAQIPVTPMPTPTPFLHKIIKGDSMLGIAIEYGVKLEDLLAANPEIDPRILSIGQEVIIPIMVNEGISESLTTPTPIPVSIDLPRCFGTEAGLACIVNITNDHKENLEGIRIGFGIYNDRMELLQSQVSVPAFNRMLPGATMPVMALFENFFESSLPDNYQIRANAVSGFLVEDSNESRYVDVTLENININVAPVKLYADVLGVVKFSNSASQVRLLAVAYDDDGKAIGIRTVQVNVDCIPGQLTQKTQTPVNNGRADIDADCRPMEFQMQVYSLGPEIRSVMLFSEAVP